MYVVNLVQKCPRSAKFHKMGCFGVGQNVLKTLVDWRGKLDSVLFRECPKCLKECPLCPILELIK